MKKPFTIYIAVISICLVCSLKFSNACGPSLMNDEVRIAVFANSLDEQRSMSPFYYSESYLNGYKADPTGVDYKRNCDEWISFGKNSFIKKDVYSIQYQTDPDYFFKIIEDKSYSEHRENTFIQWLLKKENKAALEYMKLAKKIEETQFGEDDPWREKAPTQFDRMQALLEEVLKKLKSEKNEFLKQRYAFQAVKLAHYGNGLTNIEAMKIYHDVIEKSNSVILGWAQLYIGLMQDNDGERLRYMLKAYENSEEKKVFCYQNISRAELDSIIANTKDNQEKETAIAMRSSKNFGRGLSQLKEINAINPNSKYIPFLLTREINKLENWIWTTQMTGFETYSPEAREEYDFDYDTPQKEIDQFVAKNLQKDLRYAAEVRTFLENQLSAKNKNTDFIKLSVAHLYNLTNEHQKALEVCETIAKQKTPQLEQQRNIEMLISIAYSKDITTEENKQLMMPYIKYLGEEKYWKGGDINYNVYYDWNGYEFEKAEFSDGTLLLLSKRYQALGDIVTSGLLLLKSNITVNQYIGWCWNDGDSNAVNYRQFGYFDKHASPDDMEHLIELKHKKNKTAFEQFISPKQWAKDDAYRDVKGTMYLREKQYHKALNEFAKMNPDFWQTHYEYAEYIPKHSITSLNGFAQWDNTPSKEFKQVSKYELIKELVAKQDSTQLKSITNEKRAQLYCEIGNAQFNMTYYGNSWMMTSYGKSTDELYGDRYTSFAFYNFYPLVLKYGKDYYQCQAAMESYHKALEYAVKDETKARCYLALIMCEMHAAKEPNDPKREGYRKLLEKKFGDTEVYKTAIRSCSYYY